MKNIVIGTAGHIDHGKTTLVKALTGRDTDKLKEEKERGISIDLGFTWFDLPKGKKIGIVDVPGHEKFIKNMLAGVAGIDIVMLVIAADEGIMPQTKEHMDILSLLDIQKGVIVLTKKDIVDEEWLDIIIDEIKEQTKNTFLENTSIIPVSSVKKTGLNELVEEIERLTNLIEDKKSSDSFRLPVDRVFTVAGFGTVVTGTIFTGTISQGDVVELLPQNKETRIRNIQVHEENVKDAIAGQRVALNLPNIKHTNIKRGNVLATKASIKTTFIIEARIQLLKNTNKSIKNRERLRFYQGTSEIMCRVILLDRDELKSGEIAYAQIKLEKEAACMRKDRFVLRTYSPMQTIAGGLVLDTNPPKRKRFRSEVIQQLELNEKGKLEDIIQQYILKTSYGFIESKQLNSLIGNINELNFNNAIENLKLEKTIIEMKISQTIWYTHKNYISQIMKKLKDVLTSFHSKNPLRVGMPKEELKTKMFNDSKNKLYEELIVYYENIKIIKRQGVYISLYDFEVTFNALQCKIKNDLLKKYNENKFSTPKLQTIINLDRKNEKQIIDVFNTLIQNGILYRIDENIVLTGMAFKEAVDIIQDCIEKNGYITPAQLRDLLSSSRKYALSILEHTDKIKITKRVEDRRILY